MPYYDDSHFKQVKTLLTDPSEKSDASLGKTNFYNNRKRNHMVKLLI